MRSTAVSLLPMLKILVYSGRKFYSQHRALKPGFAHRGAVFKARSGVGGVGVDREAELVTGPLPPTGMVL